MNLDILSDRTIPMQISGPRVRKWPKMELVLPWSDRSLVEVWSQFIEELEPVYLDILSAIILSVIYYL